MGIKRFLDRFKSVVEKPVISHRIGWILDIIKSKKLILVVGAPEGHELQALLGKTSKVSVALDIQKTPIPKIKYLEKPYDYEDKYDYILVFTNAPELLYLIDPGAALKEGGEIFMVCPVGNGSRDRAHVGTILSSSPDVLKNLFDLPCVAMYSRAGEFIEEGLARQMCAVEKRLVVQYAYLHFKE